MQRQLCIKLLSKISRNNVSNPNANSIPSQSQPIFSSLVRTNTNQTNISRYTSTSSNTKMLDRAFFSNPSRAKRCFSNANTVSKGQSKSTPINVKINSHSFDSGYHAGLRRFTTGKVVPGLLVTNVSVFLLWKVADPQFMMNNFMISVDNFTSGRVHTLITSAFSHMDFDHLMNNMIGLCVFRFIIGEEFGPLFLLKLYFSGALVGSIFYLVDHAFIAPSLKRQQTKGTVSIDHSKIPGLGASGAVNAIMLLHIFLSPGDLLLVEFVIPVPAILVGIYIIWEDTKRVCEGDDRVSGSAHLGGATVATIAWAWTRIRRFL